MLDTTTNLKSLLKDPSLLAEQAYAGGEWVDGDDGTFEVTNPARGDVIANVADMSRAHVAKAIEAAGEAQKEWAQWTGKERADLLIGYSSKFPTHVIEIERADSWSEGLRQALWYQAAIFKAERRHVLPVLILFGNTSAERFEQILATCDHNHVTLSTHRLGLDGEIEAEYSLGTLLNGSALG